MIARKLNDLCQVQEVSLELPKEGVPVYDQKTGAFLGFLEKYGDRIVMREVDDLSWYEQKVQEKLNQLERVFAQSGVRGIEQAEEIDTLREELETLHNTLKGLGSQ